MTPASGEVVDRARGALAAAAVGDDGELLEADHGGVAADGAAVQARRAALDPLLATCVHRGLPVIDDRTSVCLTNSDGTQHPWICQANSGVK